MIREIKFGIFYLQNIDSKIFSEVARQIATRFPSLLLPGPAHSHLADLNCGQSYANGNASEILAFGEVFH